MQPLHNPQCAERHIGEWCVYLEWFQTAVAAVKAGSWEITAGRHGRDSGELMTVTGDGIGVIPISGAMIKGGSKFGGTTDTVSIRQALRSAATNDTIKAIMLQVDSPGGTVAGTGDLAADVRQAATLKPVHAHIEDLGASAAFWVASQAGHISANPTALIGSIGTVAVVDDSSKAADMAGIKVHVISTGEHKGAFQPGTEVTDEQLAGLQERVDDLNSHFIKAVADGRRMTTAQVRSLADGQVHIASKAKTMNLIDSVSGMDGALKKLAKQIPSKRAAAKAKIRQAELGG